VKLDLNNKQLDLNNKQTIWQKMPTAEQSKIRLVTNY